MSSFTEDSVKHILYQYHTEQYAWASLQNTVFANLRKAAILVPLFIKDGEIFVWLTKRSQELRNDSGMVAFPGGMKDPEDYSEWTTCLRESYEEVGLMQDQVKHVCQLLPRINKRLILITPLVGIVCTDYSPLINEHEVESVFYLPLRRFLSSDRYFSHTYKHRDIISNIHYFEDTFNGKKYTTWGLTAAICVEVAICCYKTKPDFVWRYDTNPETSADDPFSEQKYYLKRFAQSFMKENSKL